MGWLIRVLQSEGISGSANDYETQEMILSSTTETFLF